MKTKIAMSVLGAVLLLVGASTSYAQSVTDFNTATGPNSLNDNQQTITDILSELFNDSSNVVNTLTPVVNTGNNVVTGNTSAGGFLSGGVSLGGNWIQTLNNNVPGLGSILLPLNLTGTLGNNLTGPQSSNRNDFNLTRSLNIVSNQNTQLINSLNATVNTGNNVLSNNTLAGTGRGGDVSFNYSLGAIGNGGSGAPVILGGGSVNINGDNGVTGPNSLNRNNVDITDIQTLSQTSNATVNNAVNLNANTGNNIATNNTSAGNLSSGAVRGTVNVLNSVNGGGAPIILGGGLNFSGGGTNNLTGPFSSNLNSTTVSHVTTVTENSTANLTNTLNANVNTGNNTASGNTLVGAVSSGDVALNFNIANAAN